MRITLFTICLLLFGATAVQAQELKPFKADNFKWGYKDQNGKVVIEPKYGQAKDFSEGLARVSLGWPAKWGAIDKTGKEVVTPIYDRIEPFKDGVAFVANQVPNSRLDYKWGVVDNAGKEIVPLKYNQVVAEWFSFSEGMAWVFVGGQKNPKTYYYEGGKAVLIDKKGKEIASPKYDYALPFTEGLSAVRIGGGNNALGKGKWGFVDKTGKEVIPIKYDLIIDNFKDGKATVSLDGRAFFIDKTGKEVK